MALSNTYTFTVTTNDIVNQALQFIGAKDPYRTISSGNEYTRAVFWLNIMVKQWMVRNDYAPGLKPWQNHRGYCFLANNTSQYILTASSSYNAYYWTEDFTQTTSLGNNSKGAVTINVASTSGMANGYYIGFQLDGGGTQFTTVANVNSATQVTVSNALIDSANNTSDDVFFFQTLAQPPQVIKLVSLVDETGSTTPLTQLNEAEWFSLPSRQQPGFVGDPNQYYFEPHLVGNSGQGFSYLFTDVNGAQDTSKYLQVAYLQEFADFQGAGVGNPEPDFPKEWFLPLVTNLGRLLAPMYHAVWTKEMEDIADSSLKIARKANARSNLRGFEVNNRARSTTLQGRWYV